VRQGYPLPTLVIALALLGVLAACGTAAGGSRSNAGPRLSLQERSRDLGLVGAQQTKEYRIPFTNTGGRPLEISAVGLEPATPNGAAMPGG